MTVVSDALSLAVILKVPVVLMARLLKVAMPLAAVAVAVDEPVLNVPALSVRVTVEVSVVTTFPKASSTATTIELSVAPVTAVATGDVCQTSLLAAAGLTATLNEEPDSELVLAVSV